MKVRVLLNRNLLRMASGIIDRERTAARAGDHFDEVPARLGVLAEVGKDNVLTLTRDELAWCERAWEVGNDPQYKENGDWPANTRSLSIGDVVIVGETAFSCQAYGWVALDADTVRSFTIHEEGGDHA